jgi:Domain of unknown function (DUF4272)
LGTSSQWIGGEVQVRSPQEIGTRALALGAAVGLAFGAEDEVIRPWLKKSCIERELTDRERAFVYGASRSEKEQIYFTWMAEALVVLLWAVRKVGRLPAPDRQCSTRVLADRLPPFSDESSSRFLATSICRPELTLIDKAFELQQLHAVARQRITTPNYRPEQPAVNIEIVQERHRSANWVIGYEGLAWEDVTSDT